MYVFIFSHSIIVSEAENCRCCSSKKYKYVRVYPRDKICAILYNLAFSDGIRTEIRKAFSNELTGETCKEYFLILSPTSINLRATKGTKGSKCVV